MMAGIPTGRVWGSEIRLAHDIRPVADGSGGCRVPERLDCHLPQVVISQPRPCLFFSRRTSFAAVVVASRACKRTTLFAVMAADVIVLNLWAHDVERADGQAYDVLRSVFEEGVLACSDDDTGSHPRDGSREGGLPGGPPRFPKV